jgi:hypothetical protein
LLPIPVTNSGLALVADSVPYLLAVYPNGTGVSPNCDGVVIVVVLLVRDCGKTVLI